MEARVKDPTLGAFGPTYGTSHMGDRMEVTEDSGVFVQHTSTSNWCLGDLVLTPREFRLADQLLDVDPWLEAGPQSQEFWEREGGKWRTQQAAVLSDISVDSGITTSGKSQSPLEVNTVDLEADLTDLLGESSPYEDEKKSVGPSGGTPLKDARSVKTIVRRLKKQWEDTSPARVPLISRLQKQSWFSSGTPNGLIEQVDAMNSGIALLEERGVRLGQDCFLLLERLADTMGGGSGQNGGKTVGRGRFPAEDIGAPN